jgi:hypothetical protein
MQSSIIDQIIRKNAASACLMTPEEFKHLTNANVSWHHFNRPYFFFKQELEQPPVVDHVDYSALKHSSIRHLIPHKGRYYDYVVDREYKSLSEWANANGQSLDNICYGVVKKHRAHSYNPIVFWVTLLDLVNYLDPNYTAPPKIVIPDKNELLAEFDDIVQRMNRLRSKIENML